MNTKVAKYFYLLLFLGCFIPTMALGYTLTIPRYSGRIVRLHRPAKTIFIANNDIADVQIKAPGILYISAKRVGKTMLYAVDEKGKVLLRAGINVVLPLDILRKQIRMVAPNSKVSVQSVNDNVVLSGMVPSIREAAYIRELAIQFADDRPNRVIDLMQTRAPAQVYLRVKVVELNRNVSRLIGLNDWQVLYQSGSFTILAANEEVLSEIFSNTARFNLGAFFNTLDRDGLVTILSEPNLTALSGKQASFLAGGEFPVVTPQSAFGVFTTFFKNFGVSLDFIPTLLDNDTINLQVRTEVSQISDVAAIVTNDFRVPSLAVRRAQTTIQLKSGESFAIAGLIQDNMRTAIKRFPGLGSIPILGALFRSREFQRDESELVIIVTAYIVKPTSQRLRTPLDGMSVQELNPQKYNKNNTIQYLLE